MSIGGIEVEDNFMNRAVAAAVGQVQWFLGTLAVGPLLLLVVPATFRSARETLESSPWTSLAWVWESYPCLGRRSCSRT